MKAKDRDLQTIRAILKFQKKHGRAAKYTELADAMGISKQTLWARIARLRERGIVLPSERWAHGAIELAHPDYSLMTRKQLVDRLERTEEERDDLAHRLAQCMKRRK